MLGKLIWITGLCVVATSTELSVRVLIFIPWPTFTSISMGCTLILGGMVVVLALFGSGGGAFPEARDLAVKHFQLGLSP